MSGPEAVQAAVLGLFGAIVVVGVVLAVLSRLGLVDHNGWVLRDHPAEPAPEPRRAAAGTYREPALHELVARAHCDAAAAAAMPLSYLPVSPDPRRKES